MFQPCLTPAKDLVTVWQARRTWCNITFEIDMFWPQSYITNQSVINMMHRTATEYLQTKSAPVRRARRKDARPGELLAAALNLFVEKGFAATRVEEIAQLAGVSKGTVFLYYPSKEELFKAVVRENLSLHFSEWNEELTHFTGATTEMLRYCLFSWWERIGSTKASGIAKLVMSEAQNFPELADFYQHEVIQPGNALIERILQRGIARGEFRPMDLTYGVYLVLAPMLFLVMWKHSLGHCCRTQAPLDPERYLAAQFDMLLRGFCSTPQPSQPPPTQPS